MCVAIIGAGIGGLATAGALRQIGVEPLVIEPAVSIREVGAGLSIRSVRLLRQTQQPQLQHRKEEPGCARVGSGKCDTEPNEVENLRGITRC